MHVLAALDTKLAFWEALTLDTLALVTSDCGLLAHAELLADTRSGEVAGHAHCSDMLLLGHAELLAHAELLGGRADW
jgi:hypothetical protein